MSESSKIDTSRLRTVGYATCIVGVAVFLIMVFSSMSVVSEAATQASTNYLALFIPYLIDALALMFLIFSGTWMIRNLETPEKIRICAIFAGISIVIALFGAIYSGALWITAVDIAMSIIAMLTVIMIWQDYKSSESDHLLEE